MEILCAYVHPTATLLHAARNSLAYLGKAEPGVARQLATCLGRGVRQGTSKSMAYKRWWHAEHVELDVALLTARPMPSERAEAILREMRNRVLNPSR